MRSAFSIIAMMPLILAATGCAEVGHIRTDLGEALATPGTGILPPVPAPVTEVGHKLRDLPPPNHPVAVAVYSYGDQTGQFKPATTVQTLSRAVTQGASSILIKALQDAGNGNWFTVIERERLDNLLKERRIIADMRARYLGEQVTDPKALPPLLFAGVLLDGGIIAYDSNTKTGGLGANYFGIGGNVSYSEDTVTVYLRGTSVKTGQILLSVVATKKILSYGLDGNVFRYVTFNRLLQAEGGITRNEPGSLAVEQAIEQAVLQFIIEGSARGLWNFRDKRFQSQLIDEYELRYLAEAKAAAPSEDDGQSKTAAAKSPAASPAKAAGAPATPAPTPASAPASPQMPQQMSMLLLPPGQQQGGRIASPPQGQQQAAPAPNPQQRVLTAAGGAQMPAPQVVVLPRTLEDEVPISPR